MLVETLGEEEARVLGTLVEKSLATPDYYPMTLNSLRQACNQKTSREPVTDYDEETISQALISLKKKCYVSFIPYGSRPGRYKYRHFLEDARFQLNKGAMAVLSVLLLRGSQTFGELKTRTASQHVFASSEELEKAIELLQTGEQPAIELLAKRPGWKEPRYRHLLFDYKETDELPEIVPDKGVRGHPDDVLPKKELSDSEELRRLREEVALLKTRLDEVSQIVELLRKELL